MTNELALKKGDTKMAKWIVIGFCLFIVGIIVLTFVIAPDLNRDYEYWYVEGKVISTKYTSENFWRHTKVKLNSGRTVNIRGDVELAIGEKYKFTYKKYDDWWSDDSDLYTYEMID